MDISGIIVTIYDKTEHLRLSPDAPIELKGISFTANRFPKHQLRHHRFPGGVWWSTELHPPEIGNDSAMEEGLQC